LVGGSGRRDVPAEWGDVEGHRNECKCSTRRWCGAHLTEVGKKRLTFCFFFVVFLSLVELCCAAMWKELSKSH